MVENYEIQQGQRSKPGLDDRALAVAGTFGSALLRGLAAQSSNQTTEETKRNYFQGSEEALWEEYKQERM